MGHYDRWTDYEDELLKENYPIGGVDLCKSKGLLRSNGAIQARANDMGLSYIQPWTDEELFILKTYYIEYGSLYCKNKGINRPVGSIIHKANELGLYRSYDWTDSDLRILKENYEDIGVLGCKEKGLTKSLKDIRLKANELGLEYKNSKFEWSEEEVSLLTNYFPVGGAKLCIEKGLNKSEDAIRNKAKRLSIVFIDSNSNKWSDEEVTLLNDYYPIGGAKLCIEKGLDRSNDSIRKKAKKMGLKYVSIGNGWTDKELSLLKEYYKYGANYVIEKGVNRSINGVQQKARELGLKVTEPIEKPKKSARINSWSLEELNILKQYYPIGGYDLCKENGLNRTKSSVLSKASDCGVGRVNEWTDGEIATLRYNYSKGGSALCQEKGVYKSKEAINKKAEELGIKKPFNRNLWTDEEVSILKECYPVGGTELCIERGLNRTHKAITGKANILGINCLVTVVQHRCTDWAKNEDEIIVQYYPIGGTKLCQEKGLNRSLHSIRSRAIKLGISANIDNILAARGDNWGEDDYIILKEYYPIGGSALCIEKGLNKSEGAIRRKASNLGIKYSDYKPIVLNCWRDEEIEILKKYYKVGGAKLCIEKGLKRTEGAIKSKVKQYFPDYVKRRLVRLNSNANRWTEKEIQLLLKYYPKGGYKLCKLNGLDRPRSGIIAKAQEYRISVKDIKRVIDLRDDTWSKDEVNLLYDKYETYGSSISDYNVIQRSKSSIVSKARDLGLHADLKSLSKFRKDIWSDDELSILHDYYSQGGSALCQAKGLKRTAMAIKSKAYALGLYVEDMTYINAKLDSSWKQFELDILKEHYEEGGSLLCQKKGLNRKCSSIASKARDLGLKYSKSSTLNKWVEEELELLKRYYPIGGVSLCQKQGLNRSDNGIKTKARRLGIKYE